MPLDNKSSSNGMTGAATAVTSTVGNGVGGVLGTVGGVVGVVGRGVGDVSFVSVLLCSFLTVFFVGSTW